jgi:3-oxoacyl-[acyl-carrier-protein] synthase III
MNALSIGALGYHIPPGRIGNEEMTARIREANRRTLSGDDLDLLCYACSRKFEFLGIVTRSAPIDPGADNFISMAVKASRNALASMESGESTIDCVIACGVSNPFREPSAACIIAHELSFDAVDHFDINDTCNGFLKGIEVAGLFIGNKGYENVLVVACENPFELERGLGMNITVSDVDEMDQRLSGCIIGAGAAAAVVGKSRGSRNIVQYMNKKETRHWDSSLVRVPHTAMPQTKYGKPIDGFWADARGISAQLIAASPAFVEDCLKRWGMEKSRVSHVVLHQLGNNVTFAILDKLGIAHEAAPVNTFREFGNLGTVNIPLNLAIARDRGCLKDGDIVVCINSACGFTHSAALIEW